MADNGTYGKYIISKLVRTCSCRNPHPEGLFEIEMGFSGYALLKSPCKGPLVENLIREHKFH